MIQKILQQNKIALLSLLIVLILSVLTEFFLFYRFDITDEGLYIYLLTQHETATFMSPFYTLFHFWGDIFGQTVLAYRFLTFFSLIGVSGFLGWSIFRFCFETKCTTKMLLFISLLVIGSFCQYNMLTATFSYNTASIISTSLWVGSILLMFSQPEGKSWVTHLGACLTAVSLLMAMTARPPFGVLLILFTMLIITTSYRLIRQRFKKSDLVLVTTLTVFIFAAYYFFNSELIARLLIVYPAQLQSSHQNVLTLTLVNIGTMLWEHSYLIFVSITTYYFIRRSPSSKPIRYIFPILILTLLIMPLYVYVTVDRPESAYGLRAGGFFTMACLIIAVYGYFRLRGLIKHNHTEKQPICSLKNDLFVTALCIILGLISSFGTNTYITNTIPVVLVIVPVLILVARLTNIFLSRKWLTLSVMLFIGLFSTAIVVDGQYYPHYRSNVFSLQNYRSESKLLAGIFVEKQFGTIVDKVHALLVQKNFDFNRDRLVAYPDMPAATAAIGAKAFGNPWVFSASNTDALNCTYINLEPVGEIKDVYFLFGESMRAELISCLNSHLMDNAHIKPEYIGKLYNYQTGKTYHLNLIGPYRFINI